MDRSHRPRLLVLASTFPANDADGTPAFVRDLAIEEAAEFEVLVLVPRVPGGAAEETDGPIRVRRYAYFPRRWEAVAHGAILENLRARRSLWLQVPPLFAAQWLATRRAIREFRPDAMHVHWIVPQGIVARSLARGIPMLVTTLGGDLYALDGGVMRRVKRWVLRAAAAVTVMNQDMAERVIALGAAPASVSVEPMGADAAAMQLERTTAEAGRSVRLLLVGRLVEKKGVSVLLAALRAVPHRDWELTVVGDGPLRAALEQQAGDLPVRFLGQQGRTELAKQYASADIVVAPSVIAANGDQDGLPVALIEAMSAGCAVIVSDLPGLADVAADGAGVLIRSGDEHDLTMALTALMVEPDRIRELGARAAERAQEYAMPAVGSRYRERIRRVLDAAPTHRS
ncbi:glycosyltransferase [Agrococcus sp. ProA11]|uniref:glycosyltransferase n=1 Tax=Agrococcus chionoecetis TaxID=3153752 RepID=UPI003260CB9F